MSESALHAQAMRTYYSLRGIRFMPLNAVAHHVRDRDMKALADLVTANPGWVPAVIAHLVGDPKHDPVLSVLRSMLARVATRQLLDGMEDEM